MTHPEASVHEHYPDAHHDNYSRTTFGFWIYLLSDFVLFGALFATYVVLVNSTFGGPSASDLFTKPFHPSSDIYFTHKHSSCRAWRGIGA